MLLTDAAGSALRNPGVTLDPATPEGEFYFFYFVRADPGSGSPSPTG